MKLGCCTNLLAKGDDKIGIERVELIAKTGFDYVELPLACVMELSEADFDRLRARLDRAGIPASVCCNLFPASVRVTGHNANEANIRAYLEKAFARAKKLGTSVIVFGSSGARNVEEGFRYDIAMLQILKALHIMNDCAYDGLKVVIEHICRREGNIIYTVKEGCMINDVIRLEYIRVLADTYHMFVENEPLENIYLAGKSLTHVHTASPIGRVYPYPGDGAEHEKLFKILSIMNYNGGVSIEGYSENPEHDVPVAYEFFKEIMRKNDQ